MKKTYESILLSTKFEKNSLLPYILAIIILFMVSFPILQGGFAFHNDYSLFIYNNQHAIFPETYWLVALGRPIGAVLLNLEFYFLSGVESFRYARLFGDCLLFAIFYLSYRKFLSISPDRGLISWLAALLIIILPGFLINTLWIACHVPGLCGTLAAILAYYLVDQDDSTLVNSKKILGYGLLFMAFLIYPPSAYYFLIFTIWRTLFSGSNQLKRTYNEIFILSLMSGMYLLITTRLIQPIIFKRIPSLGPHLNSSVLYTIDLLNNNILGGIIRIIKTLGDLLLFCGGLWYADLIPYIGIVVIGFVAIAAFSQLFFVKNRVHFFTRLMPVLICFLLSVSPILSSKGSLTQILYRNTTTPSALIVVLLVWALTFIRRDIFIFIMLMLIMSASFASHERLKWTATNAIWEYNFLREKILAYKTINQNKQPSSIIIKTMLMGTLHFDHYVFRDFRSMATNAAPVVGIISGILLNDLSQSSRSYFKRGSRELPVTPTIWMYHDDGNVELNRDEHFVIDMNLDSKLDEKTVFVSTFPVKGVSPTYAVDDSQYFWENTGGFPVRLKVHFNPCKNMQSYEMLPWLPTDLGRFPKIWKIELKNAIASVHLEHKIESLNAASFKYSFRPGCYTDIKFDFEKGFDANILRIGKIKFA